jgi:hypothetical protein
MRRRIAVGVLLIALVEDNVHALAGLLDERKALLHSALLVSLRSLDHSKLIVHLMVAVVFNTLVSFELV